MARPIRKGFDYFPLDTDIFNDRKIRRLNKSFEFQGVAIYIYILCSIYNENGYFIDADDDALFDLSDYIRVDEKLFKNIVIKCIEIGLFDQSKYDNYKILTSSSIQRRFLRIAQDAKRKNCSIHPIFLLVNSEETGVNSEETGVNSEETGVNSEETGVNSEESTHRKVKESIENEKKENERTEIFTFTYFSLFVNKVNTTLKKHFKYTSGGDLWDYWKIYRDIYYHICLLELAPNKIDINIMHNAFCFLVDSMNVIDRQNFSIKYLAKHFVRIKSNMVATKLRYKN